MTTKHTPGPWRAGKPTDAIVADTPADYGDEASNLHYGGHLIAESVAVCNRPLIAAAPELLEALQALVSDAEDAEILNQQQGFHYIAAERRGRINAAYAAIAKAKGEQA